MTETPHRNRRSSRRRHAALGGRILAAGLAASTSVGLVGVLARSDRPADAQTPVLSGSNRPAPLDGRSAAERLLLEARSLAAAGAAPLTTAPPAPPTTLAPTTPKVEPAPVRADGTPGVVAPRAPVAPVGTAPTPAPTAAPPPPAPHPTAPAPVVTAPPATSPSVTVTAGS